ncbi:MAG: hypothetical protein V1775_01065 [Bacteroidota bacterium]
MSLKEISLLRDLINRLDLKPFDLQSWKTNASMVLGRIFGETSRKVELIHNIQPDFSSWSLRDATGRMTQTDVCRKMGREVIEACIAELEAFGLPDKPDPSDNPVLIALEEFITVKQARQLAGLISSDILPEEKAEKMKEILKGLDQEALLAAVVKMLVK